MSDGRGADRLVIGSANRFSCSCFMEFNMLKKLGLVVAIVLGGVVYAQDPVPDKEYDAELAAKLGADEYGMKSYVFVVLKTGKVTLDDPDESRKVFAGHFSNMARLAEEKKLVLAGPFVDGAPKRGMYIFNVTTIAEAEELVKTDPAVEAGVFDYELTKLYCSAALMSINEIHTTIQKTKIE